jgi:hypothetical protein
MPNFYRFICRVFLSLPLLGACSHEHIDSDDTDDDTVAVSEPLAPSAAALCAGGGFVEGDGLRGVLCASPLELATQPATNGTLTWQPGPIYPINP